MVLCFSFFRRGLFQLLLYLLDFQDFPQIQPEIQNLIHQLVPENLLLIHRNLQDLQHIGTIIGIAGGKSKAAAILSVIRASRQDILVTDEAAATEILRMAKENS